MKKVLYLMIGLVLLVCFSGCNGDSGICMVTFDTDGGSYVASEYVSAGEKVKEPDPDPVKDGYWFNGWYKDCEFSEMWDFDNDVVNKDMTLYAEWSSGCVVAGTMVAMADGSSKKVEDIEHGDMIKTYDFYTGEILSRKVIFIEKSKSTLKKVVELNTDRGQTVKFVDEQAFFDVDAGQYFTIDNKNFVNMKGKRILVKNGDNVHPAEIVSIDMQMEQVSYYELGTEYDFNFFVNDILTIYPGVVSIFPFEIGADLKVDKAKMEADIEKYGLYTYDDFPVSISWNAFEKLRMRYWKVLVGKGLLTEDYIQYAVDYVDFNDVKY